ncbi:hypothetical protein [Streptomyces sp. T21Q-yed]|uniref:hypothetical protein n=1 Tax=Streptomyces sp. T21Q-yed TaxID=3018441 RepID=UPI0023DEE65C|nr:hypothetical protein [Streptomyces sp. T21Q-yed]MDF3142086.1 hypothetical protein [Streptomyces sp. T21Q-yed]
MALRLVLLALLLLGVGVLHTLSHAGAHGGLSAVGSAPHAHQAHAAALVDDSQHSAQAEGTPASDCFALTPSGSWLLPPPCAATWSGAVDLGALRADALQDAGGGPPLSRLSVLRI